MDSPLVSVSKNISPSAEVVGAGVMAVIFKITSSNSLPSLASSITPLVAPMRTSADATAV